MPASESSNAFKQPELSDWIKDTWTIELPSSDYDALGQAIADLENTEPLLDRAEDCDPRRRRRNRNFSRSA